MNRSFVAFLFITLFACKEISFENPQPEGKKALTMIPKGLQGKYLTLTDEGEMSKDTIIITSNGYYFGYFDPVERAKTNDEYEKGVLSDSLVLKSYKGHYFLNLNENPEWLLRVLKQEKNGDLQYMSLEEKDMDFNDFVNKLSLEIKIDSFELNNKTLYQIDPTPDQLIKLIQKGYFSKSRLVKIK